MDIETKNRILAQLDQVNKHTRRLIDREEKIPRIELDTLMEKIREFYNQIWELGLTSEDKEPVTKEASNKPMDTHQAENPSDQTESEVQKEEKKEDTSKDAEEFEQLKNNIESLRQQFEEIEKGKTQPPPSTANAGASEKQSSEPSNKSESDMNATSGSKTQEESMHSAEPEKHHDNTDNKSLKKNVAEQNGNYSKSLGETFNASKSSVNDYLSLHKSESTIGDRMKQNRVNDLKAAIDLNHKFLFITELFDGNTSEYSQTIERLNKAASLEDAFNILREKREKYNWDEKEGTFRIFNDLIHRKFQ